MFRVPLSERPESRQQTPHCNINKMSRPPYVDRLAPQVGDKFDAKECRMRHFCNRNFFLARPDRGCKDVMQMPEKQMNLMARSAHTFLFLALTLLPKSIEASCLHSQGVNSMNMKISGINSGQFLIRCTMRVEFMW